MNKGLERRRVDFIVASLTRQQHHIPTRSGLAAGRAWLGAMNPLNPASKIAGRHGATAVPRLYDFTELASEGQLKFFVFDLDSDRPAVYYVNAKTHPHHPSFPREVASLGTPHRSGSIIFNERVRASDGDAVVYRYTITSRGSEQILGESLTEVERIHTLLAATMPLIDDNLAYWIRNRWLGELAAGLSALKESRVELVFDDDVYAHVDFIALNPGVGYGLLRSMDVDDRPNPRDIVLYEALPSDLPRVAGILTTVPQTSLFHVNLRAVQNRVPNAFIRDARHHSDITALLDKHVRYAVTETGWPLRAATSEEVDAHYASVRPSVATTPERDLSITEITALSGVDFDDWHAFGVKAANLAELRKISLPRGTVPGAFAIPFYFYDEFMKNASVAKETAFGKKSNPAARKITLEAGTKLSAAVAEMLAHPVFRAGFEVQEEMLDDPRDAIKDAASPQFIIHALTAMHATYPAGQSLRYRSSTNNEDLTGFNGAGLYDSRIQKPDETEEDGIDKSLKQVFASLWNFRAFTEREFHRVNHGATPMGVLVHPNYVDELVNGAAVSTDPAYRLEESYCVNSQIGEDLVTNPVAHSVPEEILVSPDETYEVVAVSSQVASGILLLSDAQVSQLRSHLGKIHTRFERLYRPDAGESFAMEIEFKITSENVLAIKQARPWEQARPWVFAPDLVEGEFRVDLPADALTASVVDAPGTHEGNSFAVRIQFSQAVAVSTSDVREKGLMAEGGTVTRVTRVNVSNKLVEITVDPDSSARDVNLALIANRPCTLAGAFCTRDGERLRLPLEHRIEAVSSPGSPTTPTESDSDAPPRAIIGTVGGECDADSGLPAPAIVDTTAFPEGCSAAETPPP